MERRIWAKRSFRIVSVVVSSVLLLGCYPGDHVRTPDGEVKALPYHPLASFTLTVQNDLFPGGAKLKLDGRDTAEVPLGGSRTIEISPYFGNLEREADVLITGASDDGVPRSCSRHYRFRLEDTKTETWILGERSSECGWWRYWRTPRSVSPLVHNAPLPAILLPAVLGTIEIRNETFVAVHIKESLLGGRGRILLSLQPGERQALNVRGDEISLLAMIGDSVVIARQVFYFTRQDRAPAAVVWNVRAESGHLNDAPRNPPRDRRHCRPGDRTAC